MASVQCNTYWYNITEILQQSGLTNPPSGTSTSVLLFILLLVTDQLCSRASHMINLVCLFFSATSCFQRCSSIGQSWVPIHIIPQAILLIYLIYLVHSGGRLPYPPVVPFANANQLHPLVMEVTLLSAKCLFQQLFPFILERIRFQISSWSCQIRQSFWAGSSEL